MWKEWLERTLGPVPSATMAAAPSCLEQKPVRCAIKRSEIAVPADILGRLEPAAKEIAAETTTSIG
jgi:hypothetical protein